MRLFSDESVERFLADGWWTGETWGDIVARNVEVHGNRLCLVDASNKQTFMSQDPRRMTWAELNSAVDRCAELFHSGGIVKGDVVGVQIPNSVELVVTYLALIRLGAIFSPYPMAYRRHELVQLAAIANVTSFVTTAGFSGRDLVAEISSVIDAMDSADHLFVWNAEQDDAHIALDLDRLVDGTPVKPEYSMYLAGLKPHPNDCIFIMFTSGTTGIPKGVPRAHGDSMIGAATNVALPSMTSDSVLLNSMPMVNAGSVGGIFLPWLFSGSTLVQHQPFDLEVFASQIETERVTYTVVPPTILNDMVTTADTFTKYDLSSLQTVGAGSAPISGWTIKQWEEVHGVEIINFFGATEGMQLSADPDNVPDPAQRGRYLPIPGSRHFNWRTRIGKEMQIKLVDVDTGESVTGPGCPGELRVKAPNIFAGYLGDHDSPFDEDGYYRSGDIFELAPGLVDMLMHVDRKKDLIIRGGMKISAAEVESLLVGHPKVLEVAVVGRKDSRLGERACVFVVARDEQSPPELEDLVEFLNREGVAKFKLPESLELIGALPRNPSGKILKRDLRTIINGDDGNSL